MGLHQEDLILRLSADDREKAQAEFGAGPFEPMAGRPMREYVAMPTSVLSDRAALLAWVERSIAFAESLPVKEKKPRKARAQKT